MITLAKESDKELVNLLHDNVISAFDKLFHRNAERLYIFSFSLLKNEEDAKETVQETFLRVWNKRDQLDSSWSFQAFLFSISYHLIVDQLRLRLKDKNYREFLYRYFENNSDSTFDRIDFDKLVLGIRKAVDELPEKRKRIFILSREAGLSNTEIAKKLGISVKTVENQTSSTRVWSICENFMTKLVSNMSAVKVKVAIPGMCGEKISRILLPNFSNN